MKSLLATEGNLTDLSFQEKLRGERQSRPYRKPTQVDWTRSLRRTGEGSLRNSAKNLDVTFGDVLPPFGGHSKRVLTDCLTKTQVSAKAQAKV
jgi:hypothetical protein